MPIWGFALIYRMTEYQFEYFTGTQKIMYSAGIAYFVAININEYYKLLIKKEDEDYPTEDKKEDALYKIKRRDIIYHKKNFYLPIEGGFLRLAEIWSYWKPVPIVSIDAEKHEYGSSGGWFKIQSCNDGGLFLTERRIKWMKNTIASFYNCQIRSMKIHTGKEVKLEELIGVYVREIPNLKKPVIYSTDGLKTEANF